MRKTIRVTAAVVALIALGGCAATDRGADATTASSGSPSSSGPAHVGAESTGGDADDPFHLSAATWPVDLEGAAEFYDGMPRAFAGRKLNRSRELGPSTGLTYGPASAGVTAWSMETDEEIPDAKAVLAAMFGLGYGCDKATYRGTAEPLRGGQMPGFGPGDDTAPWWFACEVATAEGSPNYRAYAVGWTSGDLGWLTMTPNKQTSQKLLDLMVDRSHL